MWDTGGGGVHAIHFGENSLAFSCIQGECPGHSRGFQMTGALYHR